MFKKTSEKFCRQYAILDETTYKQLTNGKSIVWGYKVVNQDNTALNAVKYGKHCRCTETVHPKVGECGLHFAPTLEKLQRAYPKQYNEGRIYRVVSVGDIDIHGTLCATNDLIVCEELTVGTLNSALAKEAEMKMPLPPVSLLPETTTAKN